MSSVVVALLLALRSSVRSRAMRHLEILALRHQLHVLERSRLGRVHLTPADRLLWVWLSRVWRDSRAVAIVKPDTILACEPNRRHVVGRRTSPLYWARIIGRCVCGICRRAPSCDDSEGHEHFVTSVRVLADGQRALSWSWDRTLRLWDLETVAELRRFEAHENLVSTPI
jgi:hypothetical protein